MMMKVIKSSDFDERVLLGTYPTMLLISSNSCMPCKQVERILESLKDRYYEKLHVCKMYAEDNVWLVKKYSIASVPTVLCIVNGVVVEQIVGNIGISRFIDLAERLLSYKK
jgi:thioredoxin 1